MKKNNTGSDDLAVRFSFAVDHSKDIPLNKFGHKRVGGQRVESKSRSLFRENISKNKKNNSNKQLIAKLIKLINKFGKKSIKTLLPFLKKSKMNKLLSRISSMKRKTFKVKENKTEKEKKVRENDLLFLPYQLKYTKKENRNFQINPVTKSSHLIEKIKKEKYPLKGLDKKQVTGVSNNLENKTTDINEEKTRNDVDIFEDSDDFLVSDSTNVICIYKGEKTWTKPGTINEIKTEKTKDAKEVSQSRKLTKGKSEAKQENLIFGEVGGSQSGNDWKVNHLSNY